MTLFAPSFAELTPAPAVAFITPLGKKTGIQKLWHVDLQAVELGRNVYMVRPSESMVPSLWLVNVEITTRFVL